MSRFVLVTFSSPRLCSAYVSSSFSFSSIAQEFSSPEMESALSVKPTACSHSSCSSSILSLPELHSRLSLLNFGSSGGKSAVSPAFRGFRCVSSSSPDPVHSFSFKPTSRYPNPSSFASSAVAFSLSLTTELVACRLRKLVEEFQSLSDPGNRVKWILGYASLLPPMLESSRIDENRVMGCTARVWLDAELGQDGKMRFWADSDSDITRGLCSCVITVVDGAAPEEVMSLKTEDLAAINVGFLGGERSRVNTWHNVLVSMQKRTRRLVAAREAKAPAFEAFPSLVVTADGVEAKGSYAEAQVR